ncbi:uncharacterized protein I206_104177 [Kwoniella pini CBS 10737]|uniref:Uncharacterized protein n=1 Tax=Kwoniella pini CBS 10737 TaxID=1296096 RepID=A0A1B9I2H5_9TREE|nr:uncharacterized protein I206_04248 [Kwoniella pini CBS 10737]OCF49724.1 hypothetical protein I206_04248 [Kwoniella pini CBS 10737]
MSRPLPLPLSISALLASSSNSNSDTPGSKTYFDSLTYILGPLPPTSPLHLSLNYLDLIDQQPLNQINFTIKQQQVENGQGKGKGKRKFDERYKEENENNNNFIIREIREREKILIITGPKGNYVDDIQEEDEDIFREITGNLGILKKLKRIDIRHCSTSKHLKLLLTLLTESDSRLNKISNQPHHLESTPSLIILWDIANMLMRKEVIDENEPPRFNQDEGMPVGDDESLSHQEELNISEKKFKSDTCLSDYMDLMNITKATLDHLNTLHPSDPPTRLIILEPSLNALSSLPILPPLTSENEDPKMPKSARERKIPIIDGARWLFGKDSIGIIHQLSGEADVSTSYYSLTLDRDKSTSYQMRRKKYPKAHHSVAEFELEKDRPMGWRWEWVYP